MKAPTIKDDPKKPIDRSKYAEALNRPIGSNKGDILSADRNGLSPDVLKINGYQLYSGTGKDAIYQKNGNYFLYNEQPDSPGNKYGLTNIGNPFAPEALQTSGQKVAPVIDPNRKPLNLSNPNITTDPNTGNTYNPITGTQIKPIVEQYKKGGPVKGYDDGVTDLPDPDKGTTNDYAAAIARINAKKQQQPVPQKTKNNGQYLQYAGDAISLGDQLNQNKTLTGTEKQNADAAALQTTGDKISGTAIPILGLAKAAVGAGQNAFIKKDEYGYAKTNADKAGQEWSSAVTTDMWKDLSRRDYGAVAGDLLGAKLGRGLSQATGHGDQTTGGWGWINRTTGLTGKNNRKNADIASQQSAGLQAEADAMADQEQQRLIAQQGKLRTTESMRDMGYSEGGQIKGPGTGKSDSIMAKIKPHSFVVPVENAPIAEEIRRKVLTTPKTKNAKLNQNNGALVKLSNGEHLFTPEEKQKVKNAGINIDALAPNAEMKDGGEMSYKGGGEVEARKKAAEQEKKKSEYLYLQQKLRSKTATPQERVAYDRLSKELTAPKAPTSKVTATNDVAANKTPAAPKYKNEIFSKDWAANDPNVTPPSQDGQSLAQTAVPKEKTTNTSSGEDPNLESYNRDWAAATAEKPKNNFDASKLIDYGIPALQTGLGLKYLKDAGKRPIDQLDPEYLRSIETAKGNVVTANAQAKFGFSPEEQAQIDQQNAGLTASGRYDARNFAGGSSANALNMERSVINDSFARGLAAKVQNKNLIFQKQQIANDRQQYADSLVTGAVGMKNRLFNMKLDAWNTQQQTGAGLIASGLQNAIGAKQWQDELKMSKERNAMYNPQPVTTI